MGLQIRMLEQEKEELQASLKEREAAATEQRLRAEVLQTHVSELERTRPPPGALEDAQLARDRAAEGVERLQRRLLARDAAAKKYKEGCRALKSRMEELERVRLACRAPKEQDAFAALHMVTNVPCCGSLQKGHE